jgi:hypothetical protein
MDFGAFLECRWRSKFVNYNFVDFLYIDYVEFVSAMHYPALIVGLASSFWIEACAVKNYIDASNNLDDFGVKFFHVTI